MDSKFRYVLLVAQRAEQLMRGARAKIDTDVSKPTTLAKEEVDRGLIEWDYGPAPQPEL
ncbi:MAG: DNA-directed RNA polymerase subunit omega, partial [Thermoanaerobaculia bacterium]